MPVRDLIVIDEERCDGCGDCVSACAEGAIAIVDGKARLVSDSYCDGLGACLGHCPQGAITVTRREGAAFDEAAVARHLAAGGPATAPATPLGMQVLAQPGPGVGCPGSRPQLMPRDGGAPSVAGDPTSQLRHWPVQLHLVPSTAAFFQNADVLLAADCVAFAVGDFHRRYLSGRSLAIACPKLDSNQEIYLSKLVAMIDEAKIRSLQVMVMEVPCCGGLLRLAAEAVRRAQRTVPLECLVVATDGRLLGQRAVAG